MRSLICIENKKFPAHYLRLLLFLAFLLGGHESVDRLLDLLVVHADAAPLGRRLLPLRRRRAPENETNEDRVSKKVGMSHLFRDMQRPEAGFLKTQWSNK